MEPINFDEMDLAPKEVPITFQGKNYILIEASEEAAVKYRNASMKAMRMEDGKLVRIEGIADVEPLLVSLCLVTAEGRAPISEKVIRGWPARVVKQLFDRCMEMNPDIREKPPTKESLDDQIQKLQKLRADMEAGEDPEKN